MRRDSGLPKVQDSNKGAKMWLVPAQDIDCGADIKSMSSTANYNMYMFSGEDEFLNFDYLGGA